MTTRLTWHRVGLMLAMGLCLSAGTIARQRDASAVVTGTARISGVVVTQEATPQPIRRAIVSLSGDTLPLGRSTITDDEGQFDFTGVPSGRFKIAATRPGYVSIAYGATRPGRPGTAIAVGSEQQISDLRLQLARGAIITGVVRDAKGDPVPGLAVRLGRRDKNGTSVATSIAAKTDDRGAYRMFGLAAGAYLVEALPLGPGEGELTTPSDAEVDAALANLRLRRNGAPVARGASSAELPQTAARSYKVVPIFYPSATVAAEGTPVIIAAGEERGDVDITLQLVSPSAIEGSVTAPGGQPLPPVRLSLTTEASPSPLGAPFLTLQGGSDGRFRYPNVAPGNYVLTALAMTDTSMQLNFGLISAQAAAARGPQPCYFATEDVAVRGEDVSGVSLVLRPCLKIQGRVVFEGTTLSAPKDLTKLQVTTMTRQASTPNGFGPIFAVPRSVNADGTFEVGELASGTYQLSSLVPGSAAGSGWWLRSVVVDSRDILDTPLVLNGNSPDISNAVLTFSDRHTSLSGDLQTAAGQPATDYTLMAFTTDRSGWVAPFRRVQATRPDSNGRFVFHDLPPGDYFLAALTDVEPGDWQEASFLAQLVASAVRVTITEGGQTVQDLRIGRGAR